MNASTLSRLATVLLLTFTQTTVHASQDTIGPNGINSAGLTTANGQPLTGEGVTIGQVEETRPGKRTPAGADDSQHSNGTIVPEDVFLHGDLFADPPANLNIDNHAEYVAGIMISTDPIRTGVTGGGDPLRTAYLYSSAAVWDVDAATQSAESAQALATIPLAKVAAINMSFGVSLVDDESLDGNALVTQFVDWSAARHDVLYVVAGSENASVGYPLPTDNFNGITVAASAKETDGKYRRVASFNDYSEDAEGFRTSTDLLAPGDNIQVTGLGDIPFEDDGTSYAAPHVTGTVALLQQYAEERFDAGAPRWDLAHSRRHETYKAVLLNSADKLAGVHGSTRTILDKAGDNWLQSEAYDPISGELIPLDDEMGAGHLNAARAVQQFSSGEYDPDGADVPVIGWDYGHTSGLNDANKYVFDQPLLAGSYIAITIAYDRQVVFEFDGGTANQYDIGD